MLRYALLPLILISAIVGCASQPQGLEAIHDRASRDALNTPSSGATLINEAQQLSKQAQLQETLRFAPVLTHEATESLTKARDTQQRGRADNQVRVHALASIATFQHALDQTLLARETLAPSLAHLEVLNSINSARYYPREYKAIEDALQDIIATLETTGSPASSAQTQAELLSDMHALEVRTIGFVQLQAVRNQVAAMRAAGAERLIPRSYTTAVKTLAAAEDLIQKTPRASREIAVMREQSETSAAHAQVILSMVNEVLGADENDAEALVLRIERWLYNISTALKYPDIRHLPMDEQSRKLAEGIEELLHQ